ncbi:hypothetical protein [Brevibacterium litoralis]|uniref:hypothetical protein n=1 Tax=Brevibacterium litoralis TaxID=3138935 RepID=UPI0032ED4052
MTTLRLLAAVLLAPGGSWWRRLVAAGLVVPSALVSLLWSKWIIGHYRITFMAPEPLDPLIGWVFRNDLWVWLVAQAVLAALTLGAVVVAWQLARGRPWIARPG